MARGPWTFRRVCSVTPERPNAEVLSVPAAIFTGTRKHVSTRAPQACWAAPNNPPVCYRQIALSRLSAVQFPFSVILSRSWLLALGFCPAGGQNPEAQEPTLSQSRMRDWVSCHQDQRERTPTKERKCGHDTEVDGKRKGRRMRDDPNTRSTHE